MKLKLFKRRKEKEEKMDIGNEVGSETIGTELKDLCSEKPELYEALKDFMFLYPEKIDIKLEDAVKNAEKFEKSKDTLRAAVWYKIAGGLALYKGDVSKVEKYITKYAELTNCVPKILKFAEEAVKKAQEYYSRYQERGERR